MIYKAKCYFSIFIISIILIFSFNKAHARTFIILNNLTGIEFDLELTLTGNRLNSKYWNQISKNIGRNEKRKILVYNRDAGIKNNKNYKFDIKLIPSDFSESNINHYILSQKLLGRAINSDLFHGVGISGEQKTNYFSDRFTRSRSLKLNDRYLNISYRAVADGMNDNIIYTIKEVKVESVDNDTELKVLSYNTYMRPRGYFRNGQSQRLIRMTPYLKGYDVLVLSELFDDRLRRKLINLVKGEYPYHSRVVGRDKFAQQDGGVVILSKWPILKEDQKLFGHRCSGGIGDCLSDKGIKYVKVLKGSKEYHVLGSHMQSGDSLKDIKARKSQLKLIKRFIRKLNIPSNRPLLLAGDLNIDYHEIGESTEYQSLISILKMKSPSFFGHRYSFDPIENKLADSSKKQDLVDYCLYSTNHLLPKEASSEVLLIKAKSPWRDYVWESYYYELSDHYPVSSNYSF